MYGGQEHFFDTLEELQAVNHLCKAFVSKAQYQRRHHALHKATSLGSTSIWHQVLTTEQKMICTKSAPLHTIQYCSGVFKLKCCQIDEIRTQFQTIVKTKTQRVSKRRWHGDSTGHWLYFSALTQEIAREGNAKRLNYRHDRLGLGRLWTGVPSMPSFLLPLFALSSFIVYNTCLFDLLPPIFRGDGWIMFLLPRTLIVLRTFSNLRKINQKWYNYGFWVLSGKLILNEMVNGWPKCKATNLV